MTPVVGGTPVAAFTAILRGFSVAEAQKCAVGAWEAGFDLVEVPVQRAEDWRALEAVLRIAEGRPVGAGTVLTTDQVDRAAGLGCSTIISPNFSAMVLSESTRLGLDYWPGVLTPSELVTASEAGARTVKVFPVAALGPHYLRDLRGPFPHQGMIAVGGVTLENAAAFFEDGADGIAFGSSIVSALSRPNSSRLRELMATAREAAEG